MRFVTCVCIMDLQLLATVGLAQASPNQNGKENVCCQESTTLAA